MFNTEVFVEGRDTGRDDEGRVPFNIHDSVFDGTADRRQIISEVFACLVTFDRDIARNPAVVGMTFLVIRPFEYFPVVKVDFVSGSSVYYCHGDGVGWERLTASTPIRVTLRVQDYHVAEYKDVPLGELANDILNR